MLRGLLALLRPRDWVKNSFVLAPLVFSGGFLDPERVRDAVLVALLFCAASSAAYILNDLRDIESDRRHPRKALTRPLASGAVTPGAACAAIAVLAAVLFWGSVYYAAPAIVIGGYLVLNAAYTLFLKREPVIDLFCIAAGFVLRVYAGAVALAVPVSQWMFITTLALALHLAAVKRRQELAHHGDASREVLTQYTPALVNRYAEIGCICAITFYSLFAVAERPALIATIPVVIFGIYRYWFVIESLRGGESPTDVLLGDWQLAASVGIWGALCVWLHIPPGS